MEALVVKYDFNASEYAVTADALFELRSGSMEPKDIEILMPALSLRNRRRAERLVRQRKVDSYLGLWEPEPSPVELMPREELIERLGKFREAWEDATQRHMDLDDERLEVESDVTLRRLLSFYYSDRSRRLAEGRLP
jgi:hypothetical protein